MAKASGSPGPAEVKSLARTIVTVGTFGLKTEYIPLGQGLGTLGRHLKKSALLDVPSDESM